MSQFANAMEVFKLLDKSNCQKCNEQTCDLEYAAQRVGGTFSSGKLTIRILGKQFSIDSSGNLFEKISLKHGVAL